MDGSPKLEARSPGSSPPAPPGGRGAAALLPALVCLGGCLSLERLFSDEGRILLQVHDAVTTPSLADVQGTVLNDDREIAHGTTNAIGAVGLSFRALDAAPTSIRAGSVWIVLRLEREGYARLEFPLLRQDFVVLDDLLLLPRGVGLRRAA